MSQPPTGHGAAKGRIFYPTSERLEFLLASIHNRQIALPDFQRDFVWDPRATEELIESICQNYPAGSLLRIKDSDSFFFAPREFAGAPSIDGHQPAYLILDGQQRLTSLYQAFYGQGSHRYFINLGKVIAGQDLDDCVFYEARPTADKLFGSIERQAESLVFPLRVVFGERGGFEEWLDRVLEIRPEKSDEKKALKQSLRDAQRSWIRTIEEYEFPMVTLAEDTSADAICTIFETLNRTGVKLSVFDLLVARFWPEDVRLRDLWEKAQEQHPIIAEFEVEPYYVLQSVALITATAAPSCKRQDVLRMKVGQIRNGWDRAIAGLAYALQILRDDCGVILPQWLPYNTMLIPMAASLSPSERPVGPHVGAVRDKVQRWFWCSVFGQAYENAPNSQAAKDYGELTSWFQGAQEPETVSGFSFDAGALRQTTPRQRAIYRGTIALVLRNGARDFHTCNRITAAMMLQEKIDDHHIFPQSYLENQSTPVANTLRDCVLNRTLIDKETNVRIGKRAPSVYLREIDSVLGGGRLGEILKSHLLQEDSDSPLWSDDFGGFLDFRRDLIMGQLRDVTS